MSRSKNSFICTAILGFALEVYKCNDFGNKISVETNKILCNTDQKETHCRLQKKLYFRTSTSL